MDITAFNDPQSEYEASFNDGWDAHASISIDAAHLQRQRDWSTKTFGPGDRTIGIMAHIEKEFNEILADPTDGKEWCDVVILALDGAWRAGMKPQEIIDWLIEKQGINEERDWPDWRTFTDGQAIEHIK